MAAFGGKSGTRLWLCRISANDPRSGHASHTRAREPQSPQKCRSPAKSTRQYPLNLVAHWGRHQPKLHSGPWCSKKRKPDYNGWAAGNTIVVALIQSAEEAIMPAYRLSIGAQISAPPAWRRPSRHSTFRARRQPRAAAHTPQLATSLPLTLPQLRRRGHGSDETSLIAARTVKNRIIQS